MHKVETAFQKGYRVDRDGVAHGILVDVLSTPPSSNGYLCFTMWVGGGKAKNIEVHRLQAFQKFGQDMFQDGIQVRHLNGDKLDNSWGNIALGTASENQMDVPVEVRHAIAVRRNRARSKLSVGDVLEMRRLHSEEGWTNVRLAAKFGVTRFVVGSIVRRECWCDI